MKQMFFLDFPCFFYDPMDVGNLIPGFSAFSKSSLYIWKFLGHLLFKPSLKDVEHYLASMWNEHIWAVVWTSFGIAFLWDWNEKWPFLVLWPGWVFQSWWHTECSTLTASSFRIWNSSAEFHHLYQLCSLKFGIHQNRKVWSVPGIWGNILDYLWTWYTWNSYYTCFLFLISFFLLFILRLITLQYCSGFCHTLTWISHGFTHVLHSEPPSQLPPHPIPLGHPSAPALSTLSHASNLDWQFISHMIIYMFQCYSLRSSHPRLLPQSPKDCSIHLCLFCCLTYRVILTIFLNSIYMC